MSLVLSLRATFAPLIRQQGKESSLVKSATLQTCKPGNCASSSGWAESLGLKAPELQNYKMGNGTRQWRAQTHVHTEYMLTSYWCVVLKRVKKVSRSTTTDDRG